MVKEKMVFSVVIAALLAACGPTQIVEVVAPPDFVPTPELVVLERVVDGAKVEARLRFNPAAKPKVEALVEAIEIVPRAELEAELASLDPFEPRFAIPEGSEIPLLRVELLDDEGRPLEGYGYRVALDLALPGDKSAGGEGVSAPVGLGLVGCAASVLRTSSIPFVHLMELRAAEASSGARLNAEVDAVGLVTAGPSTHLGLVANGFYEAGFEARLEMGCLPSS